MRDYPERRPNDDFALSDRDRSFVVVRDDEVEPHRGATAFLSSIKRQGVWTLARQFRIAVVMADAKLDLREVRLGPGRSTIEIFAFWGSVHIIVPPGIRVDVQDSTLMGEITWEQGETYHDAPDAPSIFVRGTAIMSGVEIKMRYPGETERDAKRRRKRQRR